MLIPSSQAYGSRLWPLKASLEVQGISGNIQATASVALSPREDLQYTSSRLSVKRKQGRRRVYIPPCRTRHALDICWPRPGLIRHLVLPGYRVVREKKLQPILKIETNTITLKKCWSTSDFLHPTCDVSKPKTKTMQGGCCTLPLSRSTSHLGGPW